MNTGMWKGVKAGSGLKRAKNSAHLLAGVQHLHHRHHPTAPGKEQETMPNTCSHSPPATSLEKKYKHALGTKEITTNCSDLKRTTAAALTTRVFDQDIQLLIHGNFERAVLGVLGLKGVDAAVGLGDKRVCDVVYLAVRTTGAVRKVIRQ